MRLLKPMILESIIYLSVGVLAGYLTTFAVPSTTLASLFKLLGFLVGVSGSLLGWSAGWLDQSIKVVKELDYDKAHFALEKLRISQRMLICRWGVALASSIVVVISSVALDNKNIDVRIVHGAWMVSAGFLSLSVLTVFSLFRSLLDAADLKADFEQKSLEQARMKKLAAPAEVGPFENRAELTTR